MSGAAKLRAVLNLITILVGIIMIVLHIVAIAQVGAISGALTEIEKMMYQL